MTDEHLAEIEGIAQALRDGLRRGHRYETRNIGRFARTTRSLAIDQPSTLDVMANRLHVMLDQDILTESGPGHYSEVTWTTRTRPWWLPRWLWRRVPTLDGKAQLIVLGERWFPDV